MTNQTFINITNVLYTRCIEIFKKKSHDYANQDVLSNFKRVSAAARALNINVQNPDGYSLFMVLMKIDRINNLASRGVDPKNETMDDTYLDAINYLSLCRAIQFEQNQDKENDKMGLTKKPKGN